MSVSTKWMAAGLSDTGRKRDNNEDRFHADPERGIFIVVDGMGGQAAGEKAAETAVTVMRARLERQVGTPAERVREAITLANNEIFRLAQTNAAWRGMACVLTVALVEDDRTTIGHVGDSRLYLLSAGEIRKVTHDHSPVGEREDSGELSEREAMQHPRRNEVYRDVGSTEHTPDDKDFIEVMTIPFRPDQAILLCSDGVSDLLTSAEIRQTVEGSASNPTAAVASLVEAANRAGGKDNITAVLVENSRYATSLGVPTTRTLQASRNGNSTALEERSWFRNSWIPILVGILIAVLIFAAYNAFRPFTPALTKEKSQTGPRTWHVGPVETADADTISAVLDKAQPGDTIMVLPGRYGEQVKLREGVTVISQQPQGATLDSQLGDVIVVAEFIKTGRISGFRIGSDAHRYNTGVVVRDSNVELDDLEITGATKAGVEIAGNSAATLRGNRISQNTGAGVVISGSATPRLLHNLITRNGNGEREKHAGIEIYDGALPALIANTIAENAGGAIWANKSSAAALHLDDNFFGPGKKGTGRTEIRVIPKR
jgi:parallel beta-helix repeat protein